MSDSSRRGTSAAWKWSVCGVLFLATVLNYLDRQTMSVCGPMISEEFDLDNEQFGQLLSAFRWAYAIVQIPAGFIADRFSVRIVYALAVGLWSVAGVAAFWAYSSRVLAATRAALGVGEAFNWPCALRVTANMLPPEDRGLGNGMFTSGSAVGALIAPLVITPIAVAYGWRFAFLVIGGLGAFWIALWWSTTRKIPAIGKTSGINGSAAGDTEPVLAFKRQFVNILAHPGFWLLMLVSATLNPCWYFCADWIPKYMHDQREFSYLGAGLVIMPIFFGADVGNLAGGGLVKILAAGGWSVRKARAVAVGMGTLLILPAVMAGYVDNAAVCIVLLTMAAAGITAIIANYLACLQDISFARVGLVAGVLGAFGNLVGATVNPWIGRYVDASGNYHLIFVLLGLLPAVSLAAILTFDAIAARRERAAGEKG